MGNEVGFDIFGLNEYSSLTFLFRNDRGPPFGILTGYFY